MAPSLHNQHKVGKTLTILTCWIRTRPRWLTGWFFALGRRKVIVSKFTLSWFQLFTGKLHRPLTDHSKWNSLFCAFPSSWDEYPFTCRHLVFCVLCGVTALPSPRQLTLWNLEVIWLLSPSDLWWLISHQVLSNPPLEIPPRFLSSSLSSLPLSSLRLSAPPTLTVSLTSSLASLPPSSLPSQTLHVSLVSQEDFFNQKWMLGFDKCFFYIYWGDHIVFPFSVF